ncbi:hypothetical protein JOC55_005720 [Paenibacillus sacheonensis]|nr:hypothetical protein [Paenibacillus sacheonensis]
MSYAGVVTAGVLGNFVGSIIAYYADVRGGRRLLERYGKYVMFNVYLPKMTELKPGDYEAEVSLLGQTGSKASRYDFQVSQATYIQAKTNRRIHNVQEKPNRHPIFFIVREVVAITLSGLIVLMGIRKLGQAKMKRNIKRDDPHL